VKLGVTNDLGTDEWQIFLDWFSVVDASVGVRFGLFPPDAKLNVWSRTSDRLEYILDICDTKITGELSSRVKESLHLISKKRIRYFVDRRNHVAIKETT
jgi:hypothetical protein